jgi:hypothetical protein
MRKRTTRARQEPAIQREKVANSAAPAHIHPPHAAHKAAGAAACIPTTRPHRAGPCGLRCALRSCSPGNYSAGKEEAVFRAFGDNSAGFGRIAAPTRDFPGSSLYFDHNRQGFLKSGVFRSISKKNRWFFHPLDLRSGPHIRAYSKKTRHQPGRQEGAPVARERWIDGWEAPALARRLLVLNSGRWEDVVVGRGQFPAWTRGSSAVGGGARWTQKVTGQRADCLLTRLNKIVKIVNRATTDL